MTPLNRAAQALSESPVMTPLEKAARAVSRVQRGPNGAVTANDMRIAIAVVATLAEPGGEALEEGASMVGDMVEEFTFSIMTKSQSDLVAKRVWRTMIATILGRGT